MAVDLAPEPVVAALVRRAAEFVRDVVVQVEEGHGGVVPSDEVRTLRAAREAEVFAPHVIVELGGHGLDMCGRAVVFEEADIAAARGPVARACWEFDQGGSASHTTSIAKTFSAEAIWRVVDRSPQICGALGVSRDVLLGRFLREVRPFRIYDGPSGTHRWAIARRTVRHAESR